jgi:pyruvate decarboxylase
MIRLGLKPILFVLNKWVLVFHRRTSILKIPSSVNFSDGYEIERQINGPRAQYNQIARWNHQKLLSFFSPSQDANAYPTNAFAVDVPALQNHKSYRVSTQSELDALLNDESFGRADVIQLVEIVMPRVRARLHFLLYFIYAFGTMLMIVWLIGVFVRETPQELF